MALMNSRSWEMGTCGRVAVLAVYVGEWTGGGGLGGGERDRRSTSPTRTEGVFFSRSTAAPGSPECTVVASHVAKSSLGDEWLSARCRFRVPALEEERGEERPRALEEEEPGELRPAARREGAARGRAGWVGPAAGGGGGRDAGKEGWDGCCWGSGR